MGERNEENEGTKCQNVEKEKTVRVEVSDDEGSTRPGPRRRAEPLSQRSADLKGKRERKEEEGEKIIECWEG